MNLLFQVFWRLLLLRMPPQSIPASTALMWLAIACHYGVGLVLALYVMPFHLALAYATVSTMTMVGVVHGLLLLFQRRARYMQTVTALAGCEALLGLFLLPLSMLYSAGIGGSEVQTLLALLSLLIMGWNVAVAAHIFRHALGVATGLGFLYSVIYLIIAMTLGDMVSAAGVSG